MRRLALVVACAAAAAAASAAPAGAMPALRAAYLGVSATEWHFSLSRLRVPAGSVTIQLVDYGQDDHNLRIRRIGGTHVWQIGRTHPGGVGSVTGRLRAGRYRLWCSLPRHYKAGMHARVRVVR